MLRSDLQVVRNVYTINGKLSVDLIANVDGKDWKVAGTQTSPVWYQETRHQPLKILKRGLHATQTFFLALQEQQNKIMVKKHTASTKRTVCACKCKC